MSTPALLSRVRELYQEALRLFHGRHYERSAELLTLVLKTEESGELWSDWATAQLMCDRTAESERGYRRALELEPQNQPAAANLGILLASRGRVSEALPLLEQAANGSSGTERERIRQVLAMCRPQTKSSAPAAPPETNLLAQMAGVIRLQSDAIAGLARRLDSLEARDSERYSPTASSGRAPLPAATEIQTSGSTQSIPQPATPVHPPASAPQPGVLFRALVYDGSGYAEENWVDALGLADHHVPVQLAPIGETSVEMSLIPAPARERLKSLQKQWVDLPSSVIYQAAPAGMWDLELSGKCRVGRTMFETDRIPYSFVEPCNAMDEVWLPTRFNMETFATAGIDERKLRLVPPGVDANLFRPGAEPLAVAKTRGFSFLSIFDWQQRKGYDALLQAYLHEFKPDEDVSLILKVTQMNDTASQLEAELSFFIERLAGASLENTPPVILVRAFIPQAEMPRLYAAADCFVLPSRGEGYGRPYLEALACQLPVIATDWSGQRDFLSSGNSYLIENEICAVPAEVDLEVFVGHRWAEPSVEHLRELMRRVYSHGDEARAKAERGREDVLRCHDWSVVIPRWASEFQRLLN